MCPYTKVYREINWYSDHSVGLYSVCGSAIVFIWLLCTKSCLFSPSIMLSSLWICCSMKLGYRTAEMLLLAGRVPFEWFSGIGQYQEL